MKYCPNCSTQLDDNATFCGSCGSSVAASSSAQPSVSEQTSSEQPAPEKKKFDLKKLLVPAIAAVVVILAIIIIANIGGSDVKLVDGAFYGVDDEVFYTKNGKKSVKLPDDQGIPVLSADGKMMYYTDEDGDYYAKKFSQLEKDAEGVKVSGSGVSSMHITHNGKEALYLKENKLYVFQYGKESSERIVKDVEEFYTDKDHDIIIYTTTEGDMYWYGAKKSVKIDSEIGEIRYINENYKEIYYTANTDEEKGTFDLCVAKKNKEGEKLLSDLSNVYVVYEDGSLYYEDEDGKLFFWDGKKSTEICDEEYCFVADFSVEGTPVLVYEVGEETDDGLEYTYFVAYETKTNELGSDEDITDVTLSYDGKELLYIKDYETEESEDEDDYWSEETVIGTAVKRSVGKKLGNEKELAQDVTNVGYRGGYKDDDEEKYVFVMYWETEDGDLWFDGEKVGETESFSFDAKSGDLYWYDDDTLKVFNGKKSVTVANDVSDYELTANGDLIILHDVDDDGEGTASWWNGKKLTRVADDAKGVSAVRQGYWVR